LNLDNVIRSKNFDIFPTETKLDVIQVEIELFVKKKVEIELVDKKSISQKKSIQF
jgi:hypothetical protein